MSMAALPNDVMQEILLRFPCSASVACAVYFSKQLRGIVSNEEFRKLFRQRHPSSPLLGVFSSSDHGRLPLFENVSSSSDAILNRVICRTDTGLTYLDRKKDWTLKDCRNGRLLLHCSEDDSFCIYDPLSQRRVDCKSRPYGLDGKYLNNCLLHMVSVQQRGQSKKAREKSFRVISLQRRRGYKSTVRAVEYDSGTLEWHPHPWKKFQSLEEVGETMHAAGHIFWACGAALLLVLDTETMKFSQELFPWDLSCESYAIGELEDGQACAVCLQGLGIPDIDGPIDPQPHLKVRVQVWTIEKKDKQKKKSKEEEEEGKPRFDWKMKEEFFVSDILDKDAQVDQVTKVVNGLVVLCRCHIKDYYVINLHTKTQVAKFNNRGRNIPYLYQVPWPPSVMAAATTIASSHNKHVAGDEMSKQSPNNNKNGPATTGERHIVGDELSNQCPSNNDGPTTTDERNIAGDEVSKQCPNNNMDDPATTGESYPVRDPTPRYKTTKELPGGMGRPTREKKKPYWLAGKEWAKKKYTPLYKTSNELPDGMGRPTREKKKPCWLDSQEWAKNKYTVSDPTSS